MRPAGKPRQLERRRRFAIALLGDGLPPAEVAVRVGVNRRSVCRWLAEYRRRGEAGIRARPTPGRPAKLRPEEQQLLVTLLMQGAHSAGFTTDVWTCRRVALLIRHHFGVSYHLDHIGRLLRMLGWKLQPQPRRRDADDDSIARVLSVSEAESRSPIARFGPVAFLIPRDATGPAQRAVRSGPHVASLGPRSRGAALSSSHGMP